MTTPASESKRFSDPLGPSWESKGGWDPIGWGHDTSKNPNDIPPILLGDGPPWSEDEDLQSPIVSSRHRKHKSSSSQEQQQGESSVMNPANYDPERGFYVGTSGNGSERYYVNQGGEANGPGGEYVTYPADQARHADNPYRLHDEQQPRQYPDNEGYGSDASSSEGSGSPNDAGTPTQAEHGMANFGHTPTTSNASNGYHQPIVSTFSTSSRDLDPYPTQALGIKLARPRPRSSITMANEAEVRQTPRPSRITTMSDIKRRSDALMTPVPESTQEKTKPEAKDEAKES
ncbi:unnamed protein product [Parascedosporium putredinis]|uniref:Uncharacterized protein n=1 Tax=Parascedosporium putredinis TaxID=1442378 RepID=A0A9P1H9W8_9PEZI|nr:unnamed protein product [Parascedosporium putredinis]CAI8003432.1 unnamed protein product [Parascedosporium putredinis]